ncbi:MAG: hypothetical protein H0V52_07195 [Acidimicrobiia bacterium]|nr:hypothetical protein [Acidimicrobiia bacterium]
MDDLATIRVELEEYRTTHTGSTDELGSTVAEIGGAVAEMSVRLQRQAATMEDLTALRGDDERWAEVMGRLLDEVDAERQTGQREDAAPEGVVERLTGLEHALQSVAADVAELVSNQQGAAAADAAEMVLAQQSLVAEVAAVAAAQQGVAADLADVAAAQRVSADQQRAPLQLDEAQVRLLAEAVLGAASDMRPSPADSSPPAMVDALAETPPSAPDKRPAPARGHRAAPLRAERKAPSPGRRR